MCVAINKRQLDSTLTLRQSVSRQPNHPWALKIKVKSSYDCISNEFYRTVRTKGYSTDLLDPTQVESKKCSQIQWPVPSINAEPVDIFLGEE